MVDIIHQSDIPELAFEGGLLDIQTFTALKKLKKTALFHLTSPPGSTDSSDIFELIHGCYVEDFLKQIQIYYDYYCDKGKIFWDIC